MLVLDVVYSWHILGLLLIYWIGLLVIVGYGADDKVDSENGTIYFLLFIGWLTHEFCSLSLSLSLSLSVYKFVGSFYF